VPFELAPPGETRPPVQQPQPLSSTFTILRAELAETSALRIYAEGARTGATGLLFYDLPDRTITLYLRRGNPESAESTHGDDAIGAFLAASRLVTAEQLSKAEREALKYGNDVLAALFTLGFVNPGLVFPALAQRAAGLLLQAYLAPQGSFRFESVDLPPSKVVPLGSRWGLLAEVIRRVPLPDLKARLIDVRERPVVRRGTGDSMMDLRLTAQETRALGYFDGARSLANLAQSNAGEMDTILRVALLLREIDAASFPDVPPRAVPPPPPGRPAPPPVGTPVAARSTPTPRPQAAPSPTPRPAPVASRATPLLTPTGVAGLPQAEPPRIAPVTPAARPPPSPAAAAGELRELQARLERIRKETAFQMLGIPEHADSAMVKAAYFRLAKQFHPDTVPAGASAELARVKAEIFALVGEANRVLADETGRARYKATLAEGGPADVDVQALLQAEETFNKGTALVRARRFAEAVKAFDAAITANSREGEFYAWRGYARFFTLNDKKVAAADALRDLNQALKLNERCAPAYYFIGQVHKLTGDSPAALKYFKKCVSIDATHVDAAREIRLLAGK
jgi:DnaJ-domain-containing protein 1